MKAGKFYASSGVEIESIHFDDNNGKLFVKMKPVEGVTYSTEFIGTRKGYDASAENTGIGEVFASVEGNNAAFKIPDDALYLRATINSSRKHPNPSYQGQKAQAWVQPVGWKK